MSRRARRESATGFYHVINRGIEKTPIFLEHREKLRLLSLISKNFEQYNIKIYAYCIMSNHFHLLVHADIKELASFMAKVSAAYAQYYNYKHQRTGFVFQNRYKSQCIESEGYFWNCIRYIHMNPQKAHLCENFAQYRYSSFGEYCNPEIKKRKLLYKNAHIAVKKRFSTKEFLEFHREERSHIFIDTPEDMFLQRKVIAEKILKNMEEKMHMPAIEILDYTKSRNLFDEAIREKCKISQKTAKEIRKVIETEYRKK